MKNQWKALRVGMLLFALPMLATAAVSANQWISENSAIELNIDQDLIANTGIGSERVHRIALNANGAIEGRVAALNTEGSQGLAGLTVYFISNGKVAQESKTAADGSFVVAGLQEGVYSFVATGENGFAAYGVQVVGESVEGVNNVMEAAAVAPNFEAVKQILNENLPSQVASEIVASSVEAAPTGANRVKLNDGKLVGNVHALVGGSEAVQGTTVHILKGDEKVATVDADEKGSFMVADLEPGIYGFVATGPNGFAAVSFEAVQEEDSIPVSVEASVLEPVAAPSAPIAYQDSIPVDIPVEMGYGNSLDVCLTCGNDVGYVDNTMQYTTDFAPVDYLGESIGCGGACGATCGSCGNFAGGAGGGILRGGLGGGRLGGGLAGGRLGRLALLSGAVVGIVAIADSDDPGAASPASP